MPATGSFDSPTTRLSHQTRLGKSTFYKMYNVTSLWNMAAVTGIGTRKTP
jgi:hypothetical protein